MGNVDLGLGWTLGVGALGWKNVGWQKKLKALRWALNESKKFTKF